MTRKLKRRKGKKRKPYRYTGEWAVALKDLKYDKLGYPMPTDWQATIIARHLLGLSVPKKKRKIRRRK